MTNAKDELQELYGKIEDIWTLSDELKCKGSEYHNVAHAVSEIANYLSAEGESLKFAGLSLQAAVEGKSLTKVVAESKSK